VKQRATLSAKPMPLLCRAACPKSASGRAITLAVAGSVGVAKQTPARCVERMNRLYEQGADAVRIGDYVRRWWWWVWSGVAQWKEPSARDSSLVSHLRLDRVIYELRFRRRQA
jgi:hypothetical protein